MARVECGGIALEAVACQSQPNRISVLPNVESYVAAVAEFLEGEIRRSVPIIGALPGPFAGFAGIAAEQWHASKSRSQSRASSAILAHLEARSPSGTGQEICLAPDNTFCSAVAALLCDCRSKRFVSLPSDEPTAQAIRDLIKRWQPKSLTIVVPALGDGDGRGMVARDFLRALIEARRTVEEDHRAPPFGVITGVDAAALSQLAAKSILHPLIIDHYADKGIHFVDEIGANLADAEQSTFVGRDPAPHHYVDVVNPTDLSGFRDAAEFAAEPRNLLIVKAHGRSYCAGRGLLCGARSIGSDAYQENESCIAGFDCFSPAFHRLDPRRLDARVLLLDSCDSVDLSHDDWLNGHAAIGFLCAAGHASAVIAADGLVVPLSAQGFELLSSMIGCSTVGEWSSQLDRAVRGPNPPASFILFGDPDLSLAVDVSRWGIEATVEKVGQTNDANWLLTVPPAEAALVHARLKGGRFSEHDVLYIWAETDGCRVVSAVWDGAAESSQVWFAVQSESRREIEVRVERRPPVPPVWPEIDPVRSALANAPELRQSAVIEAWEIVRAAGRHLVEAASSRSIESGRTRLHDPHALLDARNRALELWSAAQAACLSQVAEEVVELPNVYLPAILWRVELNTLRQEEQVCPQCGTSTLFVRDYRAGGTHWRSSFDCPDCCFILDDRPLNSPPVLAAIDCPDKIASGLPVPVSVHVTNPYSDRSIAGAVQVSLSLTSHGLRAEEPVIRFELAPGASEVIETRFLPRGDKPVRHDYAVRAVALVEGTWHWSARRMLIH